MCLIFIRLPNFMSYMWQGWINNKWAKGCKFSHAIESKSKWVVGRNLEMFLIKTSGIVTAEHQEQYQPPSSQFFTSLVYYLLST